MLAQDTNHILAKENVASSGPCSGPWRRSGLSRGVVFEGMLPLGHRLTG